MGIFDLFLKKKQFGSKKARSKNGTANSVSRSKTFGGFSDDEKRDLLEMRDTMLLDFLEKKKAGIKLPLFNSLGGKTIDLENLSENDIQSLLTIQKLCADADRYPKRELLEKIKKYKKVLEYAPWDSISVMSIGVQYYKMGNMPEAIKWLRKAADMDPKNQRIKKNLLAVSR